VAISNRFHLDWSPNICVNIIQNLLRVVRRGAEFHLGLLSDDAMSTKIQFAGFSTFQ